jgi:hypothetical protein
MVLHGQLTLLNREINSIRYVELSTCYILSRAPYSFDTGLNSLKTP